MTSRAAHYALLQHRLDGCKKCKAAFSVGPDEAPYIARMCLVGLQLVDAASHPGKAKRPRATVRTMGLA